MIFPGFTLSAKQRPLANYVQRSFIGAYPLLGYVLLLAVAFGYGWHFIFADESQRPPLLAPFGLLVVMALWVMPELRHPPLKLMEQLFVAFLFALLCWPDYVALSFAGLPWITAVRLTSNPLTALLILCCFGSPAFRARLADILTGERIVTAGLVFFMLYAGMSIGMSKNIGGSINRYYIALTTWFAPFFISAYYFSKPGRVRRFAYYLTAITFVSIAIGIYEAHYQEVPWKNRLPSFLAIQDPVVEMLMNGIVRAGDGLYRVRTRFSSSIGLGEYFSMALPFMLHLLATTRRRITRAILIASVPLMLYIVLASGSRLALIGYISSVALYVLFAALRHWMQRRESLIAPAVLMVYPAAMTGFLALSLLWRRLEVMVWGGGAAEPSTEARHEMVRMGMPMIMHNPIGHGIGQAAVTLGYIAPGLDLLTIDSYFLSVGLEFGVVGFIVYFGMFLWSATRAGVTSLQTRDADVLFLSSAAIAIVNFVLSKTIYSQQENHPLAFILLGLVVALLWRHRQNLQAERGSSRALVKQR
jgi:hypothetical protein